MPAFPKKSEEENVNFTEVNQRCCVEGNEQWLENVDRTHLALASGKILLQKGSVSFIILSPQPYFLHPNQQQLEKIKSHIFGGKLGSCETAFDEPNKDQI